MTTARKKLVSVDATPYYHCVSRCVRRSFLCGIDPYTQRNFEHRRSWVEQKIMALAGSYCIDVCAYAIMSNHYHLVLHINRNKALSLTPIQIVERWKQNHQLPTIIQRWLFGEVTESAEAKACIAIIESWRTRLWDMSWFMKELNYDIAVQANREDDCKGHFWECRFKSQALLDEQALAAAMVYVDLNPVRAGIAEKPETSEFTSIKARLRALKEQKFSASFLFPFVDNRLTNIVQGIPLKLMDYIELVDWSARQYRDDKVTLNIAVPGILQRLNITQLTWLKACSQLEKSRATAIGCHYQIDDIKRHMRKKRLHLYRLDI